MKIGKLKSEVLSSALETKEFFLLSCYMQNFQRDDDGTFISPWNSNKETWDLKVALLDYCVSERESEDLFNFAEELIGTPVVDLKLVSEAIL